MYRRWGIAPHRADPRAREAGADGQVELPRARCECTEPAREPSARLGQGHHILRHPEAGGITQVVPADVADRDDGEPLRSRLKDRPGEIQSWNAHVNVARHAELTQAPETGTERSEGLAEHGNGC